MDFQTFGKNLMEVLAERSLETLRGTSVEDVKRMVSREIPAAFGGHPLRESSGTMLGGLGMTLGAFAIGAAVGAGLTALYSPTTGPELRKLIDRRSKSARKQATRLGGEVMNRLDDAKSTLAEGVETARTSLVDGVESSLTAVGLGAPKKTAKKRTRKALMNGHSTATATAARSRAKKTSSARAHHDA